MNKNPQLIMKILSIHSASQRSSTGYDSGALIPMSSNDYSWFAKGFKYKHVYNSNAKQHKYHINIQSNQREVIQVLNME
jgi:hypothetical protein